MLALIRPANRGLCVAGFLAILLLSTAGCKSGEAGGFDDGVDLRPAEYRSIQVRTRELFVLGGAAAPDPDYILGRPTGAFTDSEGRIYVADASDKMLKVFEPDGSYVRSIGAEGEGPAEFMDLTAVGISDDDRIVVEDEWRKRLTVLDPDGNELYSRPTNDNHILWPRQVRQLGDRGFLFLYKMPNVRPGGLRVEASDSLLHLYDTHLNGPIEVFASKHDFGDIDVRFVDLAAQAFPGGLAISDEGSVYFSPYLYGGIINRYERRTDGGWARSRLVNGAVSDVTYRTFEEDREPYPERNREIHASGEVINGLTLNESVGLYTLPTGELVHFSLQRPEYSAEAPAPVFMVEVWSPDRSVLGVAELDLVDTEDPYIRTNPMIPFQIAWMDTTGRFYMVNRMRATVTVFEMEVGGME